MRARYFAKHHLDWTAAPPRDDADAVSLVREEFRPWRAAGPFSKAARPAQRGAVPSFWRASNRESRFSPVSALVRDRADRALRLPKTYGGG